MANTFRRFWYLDSRYLHCTKRWLHLQGILTSLANNIHGPIVLWTGADVTRATAAQSHCVTLLVSLDLLFTCNQSPGWQSCDGASQATKAKQKRIMSVHENSESNVLTFSGNLSRRFNHEVFSYVLFPFLSYPSSSFSSSFLPPPAFSFSFRGFHFSAFLSTGSSSSLFSPLLRSSRSLSFSFSSHHVFHSFISWFSLASAVLSPLPHPSTSPLSFAPLFWY